MRKPTLYLAGAIRDTHSEDIEWRERVIEAIGKLAVILNPLAGKRYDPQTHHWTIHGFESSSRTIVKHDFWCVDHADIVLFNFRALSQKYPNIGTLVEFGRATARGAILYAIVDPDYIGHENTGMFKLHPFLVENCAMVFDTVDEAIMFLDGHLPVLS